MNALHAFFFADFLGTATWMWLTFFAVVIALLVTAVLVGGIKLASWVNQVVVAIKLTVIAAVIVFGIAHIKLANYTPLVPPSAPAPEASGGFMDVPLITTLAGIDPAVFGVAGVISGAAIVFFAFIGFDIVATTAEHGLKP